jgi:hypothetical protein
MEALYISGLLLAVLLIVGCVYWKSRDRFLLDLDRYWHVPEHALADFGLGAFLVSRDYLYIENTQAQVIFDAGVSCEQKRSKHCERLSLAGCPLFASSIEVQSAADDGLPGLYLIGED